MLQMFDVLCTRETAEAIIEGCQEALNTRQVRGGYGLCRHLAIYAGCSAFSNESAEIYSVVEGALRRLAHLGEKPWGNGFYIDEPGFFGTKRILLAYMLIAEARAALLEESQGPVTTVTKEQA